MRIACRELPGWFAQTATIVTPTPFLAGVAREQFARERLKRGLETWERRGSSGRKFARGLRAGTKPADLLAETPSLLSPVQDRALWHEIIEQEHPQLFDVSATVRLARAAASLSAEWHIPSEGELWNDHADAQQFQRWHRAFRRRCRDNQWTTRADLPRLVAGWIASGQLRPQLTAFVGFENTSPAFEGVLDAMGASGVRLPLDHAKPAKKAVSKGFDCLPEEIPL